MRSIPLIVAGPLALVVIAAGAGAATLGNREPSPAMLPERKLECVVGRATNLDPYKRQTIADITYEGAHRFALVLPPVPADRGPEPDPSADPEPVDPRVRIAEDPSKLATDMSGFFRVVDRWPERVEMAGRIPADTWVRLIIVSDIDPARNTANLFMTRAADAGSMDLKNVYQGGCRIIARS